MFVLIYDVSNSTTSIGMDRSNVKEKIEEIERSVAGVELEPVQCDQFDKSESLEVSSFYKRPEESDNSIMHDLFENSHEGFLAIVFVPVGPKELEETKEYIEKTLSKRSVRETYSVLKNALTSRVSVASQRDMFTESAETLLFGDVLNSINNAILGDGLAYKTFFIIPSDAHGVKGFIDSRFLILDREESRASLETTVERFGRKKSLLFGIDHLKQLLSPYGAYRLSYTLSTMAPVTRGGIVIGTFMRNGVSDTGLNVGIEPSTINLGFTITGLPGTGKTTEAMAIIDALLKGAHEGKKLKVVVITPTDEWDTFAISHNMYLVRLYNDRTPINFFRRPHAIDREKFYENLAMVLSSASDAGPYQNPMEKCMLNAFRKVYEREDEPDPITAYNAIEDSIIELHAKKTNSGVKYTKHGENIRSALENLRGILNRPEFSMSRGVKIEDLVDGGVVFNISNTSGATKAYLYALLLNQVYAITSGFDTNGDSELRLLVCLEEAQTMFGNKDSAAVQDIKQRIQDFRRQGIGLMLLTHNVNDIDVGIRRLCQSKLYLKQASDVAAVASKDLTFTYAEEEDVILKLKLLDSRIGAFSYVTKDGAEKRTQDTIFIKTKEYDNVSVRTYKNPLDKLIKNSAFVLPNELNVTIHIEANTVNGQAYRLAASMYAVRLKYLGEVIAEHMIEMNKDINQSLIEGRTYELQILDRRSRILEEMNIKARNRISITVFDDKVDIIGQD